MGKRHRKLLRERNERKLPNEDFLTFQKRLRKGKKVNRASSPTALPVSDEA